ncbi:NAD-dependent epimerase/dehydratase family protein [Psychrobacillus sp.]|uniref:NAD-dependent epimerase/dehydratase family protein n=1 Tax=Psychrobacillus sp. TaxID=1871623 RepID=UPI0028BF22E0|nr:NAD-dependent epimerase/dehydratase family protein [Psychrobacillus sp.]
MTIKPKLMITGANGFTGIHACDYFKNAGYEIIAVSRTFSKSASSKGIDLEYCDLTNRHQVNDLIQKTKPDILLHLAGQNHVQKSWEDPITSFEANVMSTVFLVDAIRKVNINCKVIIVGSVLQFDIGEISSLLHPYSLSKTIQVLVAQSWELLYGMTIMIAKPTNLIGPGVSNGVCSILAKKVSEMELKNADKVLVVNNLFAQRDFIDVRDVIRAYEVIFKVGESGLVYDISSGHPRYLKEITDTLKTLSNVDFTIQTMEDTIENINIITSSKVLFDAGWNPLIPFEKSMEDLLHYHRDQIL